MSAPAKKQGDAASSSQETKKRGAATAASKEVAKRAKHEVSPHSAAAHDGEHQQEAARQERREMEAAKARSQRNDARAAAAVVPSLSAGHAASAALVAAAPAATAAGVAAGDDASAFPPGTHVHHPIEQIKAQVDHVMDTIAAIPVRVTPSIISVFTEKGGVGKTSSSLALGWALANAGRRVLLIDGDGQRSLSGWALGTKVARAPYNGNVTAFVNRAINGPQGLLPRTLYEQMMEVHLQTSALRPAHAITLASRLFLVPGHRNTLSFDKVINRTEALTQAGFMAVNNSTGLPYAAVMATAAAVNAEFVLLDLNPNAGDLNRVLVSTSHYVLMPTIADFFCAELITEFQTRLTEFSNEMAVQGPRTQAPQGSYPTPPHMVKFLGILVSRYQLRKSGPVVDGLATDTLVAKENDWLTRLRDNTSDLVVALGSLTPARSVLPSAYAAIRRVPIIGMIKDFNTLGDLAHLCHKPVPYLTDDELIANLPDTRQQVENFPKVAFFRLIFMEIARTCLKLM